MGQTTWTPEGGTRVRAPAASIWLEPRTVLAVVIVGYVLTRLVLLAAAGTETYLSRSADLQLFEGYAADLLDGAWPYRDVAIEYPPLALPVLLAPALPILGWVGGYVPGFIVGMFLLDALTFAIVARRARRRGTWAGPVVWIVGTLLLGPIVYHRLDMAVVCVSVAALARLSSRSPSSAAGWATAGAAVKFHPAVLLPPLFVGVRRRVRAFAYAVLVGAVTLAPFLLDLRDLWRSTVGYHLQWGIQAESTWAVLDLAGGRLLDHGFAWGYVRESRSFEVSSSWSGVFEVVSPVLAVLVVVWVTWKVWRSERTPSTVALACYAVAALILATGTVFSPQFVVWVIALAAVALTYRVGPSARRALLLVLPIALLTQLSFMVFDDYAQATDLAVLAGRNALVVWSGWAVARGLGLGQLDEPG